MPLAVPEVDEDTLDEPTRRAGWLDILARRETLGVDVVRAVLSWDNGSALPFSKVTEIDPAT